MKEMNRIERIESGKETLTLTLIPNRMTQIQKGKKKGKGRGLPSPLPTPPSHRMNRRAAASPAREKTAPLPLRHGLHPL